MEYGNLMVMIVCISLGLYAWLSMVSVYSREMNLFSISIIIILFCEVLYSQENTIAQDTFEPQLDKIAHLATSFGLYYTFHTMYQDSLLPVLHDSIPIELHSMLSALSWVLFTNVIKLHP